MSPTVVGLIRETGFCTRTGYARVLWFFWSSTLLGENRKYPSTWILMADWCVSFERRHNHKKKQARDDERHCMTWPRASESHSPC
jgi:hypothetical protein